MRARVLISLGALAGASAWCVLLLVVRQHEYGAAGYPYLVWNLTLAWVPLLLAALLVVTYARSRSAVELLAVGGAWLVFLPNAPYMPHGLHPPRHGAPALRHDRHRVVRLDGARARLRVAGARPARRHTRRRGAARLADRDQRPVRGELRHLSRARPALQQLGCRPPSASPLRAGEAPGGRSVRQPPPDRFHARARRRARARLPRSLRFHRCSSRRPGGISSRW